MTSLPTMNVKVPLSLWMNTSHNYIGIFGNADPLDSSQWIEMVLQEQTNVPILDLVERTCEYFITSLHYEFLYTKVGTLNNPQKKIIGARTYYETETITYISENNHNQNRQNLMLTTMVTFIEYNEPEKPFSYSPPPPPILLSVPYDMFYPFEVNAASSSRFSLSSSSYLLMIIVSTLTCLFSVNL